MAKIGLFKAANGGTAGAPRASFTAANDGKLTFLAIGAGTGIWRAHVAFAEIVDGVVARRWDAFVTDEEPIATITLRAVGSTVGAWLVEGEGLFEVGGFADPVEGTSRISMSALGAFVSTADETLIPTIYLAPDSTATVAGVAKMWSGTGWEAVGAGSASEPGSAMESEIMALIGTASNNACKYALLTYLPTAFPGSGAIASFGGTTEQYIRPPAACASGLAKTIASGVYDPTKVGVSESDARLHAVRLATSIASTHKSNGGTWGGDRYVGPYLTGVTGWQESLWATYAGGAAWLLWSDLSTAQRTAITNMVVWEADRMLSWKIPFWKNAAGVDVFPGDSKTEEIAWDSAILALALVVAKTHAHANRWWQKLAYSSLAMLSRPADLANTSSVLGYNLSTTLLGTNILDTGELINHGEIAPDYSVAHQSLLSTLAFASADSVQLPASLGWNVPLTYAALPGIDYMAGSTPASYPAGGPVRNPGGSMYPWPNVDGSTFYPQGVDWGTMRSADKACMDVLAYRYGYDRKMSPGAGYWAKVHLQKLINSQSRFATGQTYTTNDFSEDSYGSPSNYPREMWVLAAVGDAAYALKNTIPSYNGTAKLSYTWASTIAGLSPAQWLRFTDAVGSTTAEDASGNVRSAYAIGTVSGYSVGTRGSIIPSDVTGSAGGLSGNAALRVDYAAWMNGSAYSIVICINRYQGLMASEAMLAARRDGSVSTGDAFTISVDSATGYLKAAVFPDSGSTATNLTSTKLVFDAEPHVIILTVAAGAQKLYVDGVLVASASLANPMFASTQHLTWGSRLSSGAMQYPYHGIIGDCVYFTQNLSTPQVSQIAAAFAGA